MFEAGSLWADVFSAHEVWSGFRWPDASANCIHLIDCARITERGAWCFARVPGLFVIRLWNSVVGVGRGRSNFVWPGCLGMLTELAGAPNAARLVVHRHQ